MISVSVVTVIGAGIALLLQDRRVQLPSLVGARCLEVDVLPTTTGQKSTATLTCWC